MPKNEVLCVVPWVHLNFEPDGKVIPCCLTNSYNYFVGDLNKDSIEEIWNSENMKGLRRQFIEGNKPKICSSCFDLEKTTKKSVRYFRNKEFSDVINIIPDVTEPDGTCNTLELKFWDFRFSNLCNFKCRSCGPRYSSAWVSDFKKLKWSNQEKVWNIQGIEKQSNFEFLKTQIPYVNQIYFAGGEPLLMQEHWQILDLLTEHKKFNVKINYSTNCSTFKYNGKNVLNYWKQWNNNKIEILPSIDEIEERAELIRHGTEWNVVEKNLKLLVQLDNVSIKPCITVGAWNVKRLPVIISRLIEIGVINIKKQYQNFVINLLEQPSYYHVHILPNQYRKEVIIELKEFISNYNKTYNTSIDHIFLQIIEELDKPYNQASAKEFLWYTEQIDSIRNENLFTTIPELCIIKEINQKEIQ